MSLEQTLKERGSRYGDFTESVIITKHLKITIKGSYVWSRLSTCQREALKMIAVKIGFILNGDPNYIDNWHDIAGFATLVEKELLKNER